MNVTEDERDMTERLHVRTVEEVGVEAEAGIATETEAEIGVEMTTTGEEVVIEVEAEAGVTVEIDIAIEIDMGIPNDDHGMSHAFFMLSHPSHTL